MHRTEIDTMITSIPEQGMLEQLYEKILGPLEQYDREHRSDYTDFLQQYLSLDGSVQELAAKRYVHRNTVNYQLNKIKKILGNDLGTLESRFELMLAYRIRDAIK